MKILQLTHSVSRSAGGLFESVRRLGEGLEALGVECTVFCSTDEFTGDDKREWRNPVHSFDSLLNNPFGFSLSEFKAVRNFEFDVGFCHGLWLQPSLILALQSTTNNVPWVIHPHGMADVWALRQSSIRKRLALSTYQGAAFRRAGAIRALNVEEAASVRQLIADTPIFVIPNSVDIPTQMPDLWRLEASFGLEPKTILFLGRLHEKKGITELITAWSSVRKEMAGYVLKIAGWGDPAYISSLKELAQRCELGGSICFVGPAFGDDKERLFREAVGFVLPSFSEGLPVAVLEAWARTVPTIISPQCNLRASFERGAALKVFPSSESIAEALCDFSRMSLADLTSMATNAFNLCKATYTQRLVAEQMADACNWLVGAGQRPNSLVDL